MADSERTRRDKRRIQPADPGDQVVVIGLGRFGGSVAEELVRLGFEVLGIDGRAEMVQRYADRLTHVVEADATSDAALAQLGVGDFRHAVVGIGSDIEASVLTTAAIVDMGVPNIWAKAVTRAHGRILERVGAHHIVFPEHDMGHRVAHLVGGRIIDWFQLDEHFAMVETVVPSPLVGRTLGETGVRSKYGVTVVCIKPLGEGFTYATPDTVLEKGAVVVVAGPSERAEGFARLD
ncbi:MAG TPA: TrkA family potassium uptake protein [Acidimicrobiales bacterium]|nr:TrkA family potassium uptake protein [Acidimicrobiales bacterium]HWI02977.1 TrkA family potassium uptake protein [Acidimicrobiales bacterium]